MSRSAAPPNTGDRLGGWTLAAPLGAGGMATVYRADGANGAAAVKVLHAGRVTADEVKRFQREFLTLERLAHPNIVRVYEAGEWNGYPWIAMELVEGTDLGSLLESWDNAPPSDRFEQVERLFAQIADALAYVHENGVIHRDLKPGNVLVGRDGRARLTDFGVVKDPEAFPTSLTMAGRLVGTVAFMAPEQITGESPDARADLYSLGALLYVALTGKRPIVADSIAGYLARHLTETPSAPSDLDPRIPPRLDRVCMRLLEKDPTRRYGSAREALDALTAEPPAPSALPLHGRDAESAALLARVGQLEQSRVGGVVAVTGRPGSGRTRLLAEAVAHARNRGLDVVELGPTRPLETLSEALSGPKAEVPSGPAAWCARMGDRPWLLTLDDVEDWTTNALDAVAALLRAHVAVDAQPLLLLVACSRDAVGAGHGHGLLTGTATGLVPEVIPLPGIDRDALRAVLRDRGLHGALAATLARRLHDELDGLPGGALAQVEALLAAGLLTRAPDGSLRASTSLEALRKDPLPLPAEELTAADALRATLASGERAALDAVAVFGAPTPAEQVAAVAELSPPAVGAALAGLARAGHLVTSADALSELWSLPSARLAQALRESLPGERRAALHRAVADLLIRAHRRRLASIAETAAHHLLAAGDPAAAYPLLVQAAQRALRRGDPGAARELCARAEAARPAGEAASAPEEALRLRAQLGVALGDALRALGQPEAAGAAYGDALRAGGQAGDRAARGRALAGAGLAALDRGRTAEAAEHLEPALGLLEQGEPVWPEAARAAGLLRLARGDLPGAAEAWSASVELGRDTRDAAAEMQGLLGLARLARAHREHEAAVRRVDEAVEVGRAAGDNAPPAVGAALAEALHRRAVDALRAGDWIRAGRVADTLESLADSTGVAHVAALAGSARIASLEGLGEHAAAARGARTLLTSLRMNACRHLGPWCAVVRVLAASGEAEELVPELSAEAWLPDPPESPGCLRHAALALALSARRPGAARDAARDALARSGGHDHAALVDVATALRRAGDAAGAAEAASRALLGLDDRRDRALVQVACRVVLARGTDPAVAERLRRTEQRSG
jgi:tetratricopeptide (TPR) repeat protein